MPLNFLVNGSSRDHRDWLLEPRPTRTDQVERPWCSLKWREKQGRKGDQSMIIIIPYWFSTMKIMPSSAICLMPRKKAFAEDQWLMIYLFSSSCRRRRRVFVVVFFHIFIYSVQTQMSTTMDQVVKKAKDSFGPIFDKSLHDLVRGIRNHKENEVRIPSISTRKRLNKFRVLVEVYQWSDRWNQTGIETRQHVCQSQCCEQTNLCQ